jgi:uncharacterized protein YdcH (DUF465 family)
MANADNRLAPAQHSGRDKELDRLQRRHKKLKERVAQYEARVFLTTSEAAEVAKLKKEKLATKDMISTLRSG